MEATHPFLETAVIGINVVDVEIRSSWVWLAGSGQDVRRDPGLAGKSNDSGAPIAAEFVGGCDDTPSAAVMDTRFNFGSTASVVAP
jgi:hypothetical protein